MEYNHKDGDSVDYIRVSSVGTVPVENGTFNADPPENIHETLVDLGHEPVGGNDTEDTVPDLTEVSEEDLVTASYDELRSIASDFDDIDGRSSQGEIEEALIKKRRAQENE